MCSGNDQHPAVKKGLQGGCSLPPQWKWSDSSQDTLEPSAFQVTVHLLHPSPSQHPVPLLAVCLPGKTTAGRQADGHLTSPTLAILTPGHGKSAASILGTWLGLVCKAG